MVAAVDGLGLATWDADIPLRIVRTFPESGMKEDFTVGQLREAIRSLRSGGETTT